MFRTSGSSRFTCQSDGMANFKQVSVGAIQWEIENDGSVMIRISCTFGRNLTPLHLVAQPGQNLIESTNS